MSGRINDALTAGNDLPIVPRSMTDAWSGGNIEPQNGHNQAGSTKFGIFAHPFQGDAVNGWEHERHACRYSYQTVKSMNILKKMTPSVKMPPAMASVRSNFPGLKNLSR